jgi:hypothetical protein
MLFLSDSNGLRRLQPDPVVVGGASVTLGGFEYLRLVGDDLAFKASGPGVQGVFTLIDDTLSVIADTSTEIPGGSGTFIGFSELGFNGSDVVLQGVGPVVRRNDRNGLYTDMNGTLELVVNQGTPVPGIPSKTFSGINLPRLDGSTLYFAANYDIGAVTGIYTNAGSNMELVIDTLPSTYPFGGGKQITFLSYRWVDNGNLLISVLDTLQPNKEARLLRLDNRWYELVRVGDIIDGVAVERINDSAIGGNLAVLSLDMADGTTALYTVMIPEPVSSMLMAVGGLLMVVRRRSC